MKPEPMISIVMPCYNAEEFLEEALNSVIGQVFTNWELIVVNDGSTDASGKIARQFQERDARIRLEEKENGGYVSARLHGLRFISPYSRFLHFFDADDILHPEMLSKLYALMITHPELGAAYCNHILINPEGIEIGLPQYGTRVVPTLFGVKKISDHVLYTSFISIFCWAARMIEPMTLIRREAYEQSSGWDIRFGKGRGNIGDGTLLFSEIALTWKAGYLHEPLYYYRKHPAQATAEPGANKGASEKILHVWREKLARGFKYSKDIKAAMLAYEYRIAAFDRLGSVKYYLRNYPLKAVGLIFEITYKYLISLRLIFYRNTKVFDN